MNVNNLFSNMNNLAEPKVLQSKAKGWYFIPSGNI